jgi:lysozyme
MATNLIRCMFDMYHGDSLPAPSYATDQALFVKAKEAGWPMMIHKLTQGSSFIDPKALGRLLAAKNAGLMLGVYHFMNADPVSSQAAYFMHAVGQLRMLLGVPLLLVVDNEPNPATAGTDTLADGVVGAIKAASGKFPLLYGNRYTIANARSTKYLIACKYWLAEYGNYPVPPLGYGAFPGTQVPFHQYSDGKVGPHPTDIPGVGPLDQSEFNGSLDDLAAWFAENAT